MQRHKNEEPSRNLSKEMNKAPTMDPNKIGIYEITDK